MNNTDSQNQIPLGTGYNSTQDIMNHPKVQAGIRLADNFDELEKCIRNARMCIIKMSNDWQIVNHKKSEVNKMMVINRKLGKISQSLLRMKEDPNQGE